MPICLTAGAGPVLPTKCQGDWGYILHMHLPPAHEHKRFRPRQIQTVIYEVGIRQKARFTVQETLATDVA